MLVAIASGCKPTLDDTSSLVTAPRVLAVRSTPAEAKPGEAVAYTALFVDATGTRSDGPLDWALCTARKPLTELGPVNPACLAPTADWLVPLGDGLSASGALPMDACRQFGPDTPEAKAGEPPGRPVDPDLTGGYYQPLRVMLGDAASATYTAAETRLTCGLAGASQEDLALFQKRRRTNQNPLVDGVDVAGVASKDGAVFTVSPGARVALAARWADCPVTATCGDAVCSPDEDAIACPDDCKTPLGCTGSELYGLFDPTTRSNELRREAMRVSWFATAGSFDSAHTGTTADAPAASSGNTWTAPETTGDVTLWVVLRDDRGGVGWLTLVAQVK